MRSLVVGCVIVIGAVAAADPGSDGALPKRLPVDGACIVFGDPLIGVTQRKIYATSEAAFRAELARKGFELTFPTRTQVGLTGGAKAIPIGTIANGKLGGPISRDLNAPGEWELVKNKRGDLYRLTRVTFTSNVTTVTLCGCEPPKCPQYGSPCPACGNEKSKAPIDPLGPAQTVYDLPAGTQFKGEVSIRYGDPTIQWRYEKQNCPKQACKDPPK